MTNEDVGETMRELAEMGYIEKTGELRPGLEGRLEPVYRTTALGHVADYYVRQGLTFEAAMAKAKTSN